MSEREYPSREDQLAGVWFMTDCPVCGGTLNVRAVGADEAIRECARGEHADDEILAALAELDFSEPAPWMQ